MNKITLPSFSRSEVTPEEMRQLVSALELRFGGVEDDVTVLNEAGEVLVTATLASNQATLNYATAKFFYVDLSNAVADALITIEGGPTSEEYGKIEVLVRQSAATARGLSWTAGTAPLLWEDGVEHSVTTTLQGYTKYVMSSFGTHPWFCGGKDYS